MKKAKIKLKLNKRKVSTFEVHHIVGGGVTGDDCKVTQKYYHTCFTACEPQPSWFDCTNTFVLCDH
ncbi:MAG: hypothetical protein AAF617_05905 [Bacteroidota bacterium]